MIPTGLPSLGPYSSSKAALHAITDTYITELAPFGIKVIGVHPGGFRTNGVRLTEYQKTLETKEAFPVGAGAEASAPEGGFGADADLKAISAEAFFPNSPKYTPPADAPDAYKVLNEMAGKWMLARAGKEAGDPLKAADVMIDLVRGTGPFTSIPQPPRWIGLGSDCIADIRAKCTGVLEDIDRWESVSQSTDFGA